MLFRTHLAFGLFVALMVSKFALQEDLRSYLLFVVFILFGAVFPDVDHPDSKIGRLVRPVAVLFEHRGFFHSFFAMAIFAVVLYVLSSEMLYPIAFLLGYSSHILLDSLTIQGIMPLHPVSRFRVRGFMKAGAFYEHVLFFILVAAIVFMFLSV